jgi:hypothetical protein
LDDGEHWDDEQHKPGESVHRRRSDNGKRRDGRRIVVRSTRHDAWTDDGEVPWLRFGVRCAGAGSHDGPGNADLKKQPALSSVRARLDGSLRAKPGRHYYAFARVHHDCDGFVARVLDNQCSSLARTSAEANAFVVVPPGDGRYDDGALIDADIFEWPSVTFTAG